jgi:hypothetical protein
MCSSNLFSGRILPGTNFKVAELAAFLFAKSALVPCDIRRNPPRLIACEQIGLLEPASNAVSHAAAVDPPCFRQTTAARLPC